MKKNYSLYLLLTLLLALCLAAQGCATDHLNMAAKSIISAQEVYDATMSASAEAYKAGIYGEEGKEKIIAAGTVAHGSIALAQTALLTCLSAGDSSGSSALEAALGALHGNLLTLINQAMALGVSISGNITLYRAGGE